MTDDLEDAFVSSTDENGRVNGIMDRMTADYIASKASNPTQKSLDALLSSITRVRVVPFANYLRGTTEPQTLLDTSNTESLASFRTCFAIVEDPESFSHCMCCGEPHLELYSGAQLAATLDYHHGISIRWDFWKHDACLKEPARLLDWMSAHGVDGPRREVEERKQRSEESRRNVEYWLEAMPNCFRPFWKQMEQERNPELHRLLLEALRLAFPIQKEQALTLFGWFGSGACPWSGFPSYESIPEQLLLHYPTQLLADVLMDSRPTETQWRGAARYFGGWNFGQVKKKDRNLLTPELKQRLFAAAQATKNSDNIERAQSAFGD